MYCIRQEQYNGIDNTQIEYILVFHQNDQKYIFFSFFLCKVGKLHTKLMSLMCIRDHTFQQFLAQCNCMTVTRVYL